MASDQGLTSHPGRGDVTIEINGDLHPLSLTLAALTEIEAGLGANGFNALADALKVLDGRGLIVVLSALLAGGGAQDPRVLAGHADPRAAAEAIAACFKANLK